MTKKCRRQWLPRWFLGSGFLWRETRGSGRQRLVPDEYQLGALPCGHDQTRVGFIS